MIRTASLALAMMSTVGCAPMATNDGQVSDRDRQVHDFLNRSSGMKCEAEPVQEFVGQKASRKLGAKVLAQSGAKTLRWAPPHSAMTMDYRIDRLNIFYDDAMVVTKITCG